MRRLLTGITITAILATTGVITALSMMTESAFANGEIGGCGKGGCGGDFKGQLSGSGFTGGFGSGKGSTGGFGSGDLHCGQGGGGTIEHHGGGGSC